MTSNEFEAILNILEGLHSSINTIDSPNEVIEHLRAGSDSSRPFPLQFCDPNMMVFHPLVSKIWEGTDQIECAIQAKWLFN